ncbi:hypothetical protein SAMN05216410_2678 [Sanguibacter gelidistatuariae]|uniref:Pyrroline-5-carboxylate reductase catalytic N-terminal domain-containing protein n=1 Tax=Sanguibacter gelidistatuariae TaxID=1814289 RepID=A0A1G6RFI8_9MICO|nr:NAD(P)-binding domain-containing protein [Sanguibacter gelidistatuariae]SDD03419.1 hypothetical protein SAMN05216410_2678 [Sanguibacter gelidistatuariae]
MSTSPVTGASSLGTIAVLGAGRVGTAVARQALRAGYDVLIAASGDPADIELIASIMAPGARAVTAAEAAEGGDVVVLSIPLGKVTTLDPATLDGKIVVDAMNFWAETDGTMPTLADADSSSHLVADTLPGARLVKTLNHIGYHDLDTDHRPAGTPDRRALAVAGDDAGAKVVVAGFIAAIGFDVVDAGPLVGGLALEPGTAVFTGVHTRAELEDLLGVGVRVG